MAAPAAAGPYTRALACLAVLAVAAASLPVGGGAVVEAQSAGTCKEYGCGKYSPGQACQCNDQCAHYNNCCADFNTTCGNNPPSPPSPPSPSPPSPSPPGGHDPSFDHQTATYTMK